MKRNTFLSWHDMACCSLLVLTLFACREPDDIDPSNNTDTGDVVATDSLRGFYVLCEGTYGGNDSSLDYYDFGTAQYKSNIYGERNPSQVMGLGDVGNDLAVYGGRLYAVINSSHRVEVMDAANAHHIGSINITNCRYLAFHEGYAYISSYGSTDLPDDAVSGNYTGYVAKVDTATLNIVGTCAVGYQPEELAVLGNRLYGANSGGYRYATSDYDHTISVIDLASFTKVNTIDLGADHPNLHRLEAWGHDDLLAITARGDYYAQPGSLMLYSISSNSIVAQMPIGSTAELTAAGDTLYFYHSEWGQPANFQFIAFDAICKDLTMVVKTLPLDASTFVAPYGLGVNPETKDILVCDARDYVSPGHLYCFAPDGTKRWQVTTGVIPSRIAFTYR